MTETGPAGSNADDDPANADAGAVGGPSGPAVPPGGGSPRRRVGLLAVVAGVAFALDLVTKVVAVAQLEGREPVRLLGGGVYLVLLRNPGAAFSMATGMTWLLTLVAVGVVVGIIWIAPRLRSVGWALGLGLMLGGALGNLADRIFRSPAPLHGHVVDFVSLFAPDGSVWPVFNVADSALVGGVALLVVLAVLGRDYDGSTVRGRADQEKTTTAEGDDQR
ncbi:signal peptidase II [Actinoalloteichus caeruleus]|uniref:signal peptidase II n=1 Tax=Actinoalloteichus cyanogriseus TaxID=2893586 RepID=UPI0004011A2E